MWQLSKKTNPWGQLMKSSFSVLPRPIHKKTRTTIACGMVLVFARSFRTCSKTSQWCRYKRPANMTNNQTQILLVKTKIQGTLTFGFQNSWFNKVQEVFDEFQIWPMPRPKKIPIGLNTAYIAEYHIQLHRKLLPRQHPEEMQFYME